MSRLEERIRSVGARFSDRTAIEDPDRGSQVSYAQLEALTAAVARSLEAQGVGPGDRVGIYARKSIGSVAALLGTLRTGAAYVPVDPTAPPPRNAFILRDCGVTAVLSEPDLARDLAEATPGEFRRQTVVDGLTSAGVEIVQCGGAAVREPEATNPPTDLAYVLYTSGSTGNPKGVMHTHRSALAFVDWCADTFLPTPSDRFSSHAPIHFDLSIHDLYVPLTNGATLVLIGEDTGKLPVPLAQLVARDKVSIWYSTPSILRLMVEFGRMDPKDYPELRIVHFAGEVFPIKHLAALKAVWTRPRYFNLFGPTETNVCTYLEIPEQIPEGRTEPYPIGSPASGDECLVLGPGGQPVGGRVEGELLVKGPSVMAGYWNLPEKTKEAFWRGPDGALWYRTGDVVKDLGEQCFDFLGRRDRMVKRRGYRVELGEIESALYRHDDVSEAAVVAFPDHDAGVRVHAFVVWKGADRPSLIRMKQFCAKELPGYMVPDAFSFPEALPKTSTDKTDYQKLMADES